MKLTRNKLFSGLYLFGITTILLVLFDIQYFYLRAIFSFIFLSTTSGLLIMLMLKIRKIGFWEYLVYTVGLSIAFLMFAGLAVNWILPWLHITDKPLSLASLLISFGTILSIFGIIAYKRNKDFSLEIKFPKLDLLNKVFLITPIIFPVLSILGANTLNNGGPNYLTMIMLGGIAVYVFMIVLFRNKLSENVYPWSILLTSVSLLLMYSLRSWHISGWDINEEYRMFQVTKSAGFWSPDLIKHAYNSCLSLTILPTIISKFVNVNDEYIFKFIYQLIFCFVPLTMYCLYRKYASAIISFLAVFFFIAQPYFIQPMTALARQEIAFLFFALTLLVLLTNHLAQKTKNALFVFFGFSMVVSHYSTTYVAIILFILSYILLFLYRKTEYIKFFVKIYTTLNLHNKNRVNTNYSIKLTPLLLIIIFTFIWGTQLTKSSSNVSYVLKNTASNMKKAFSSDLKSTDIKNSLAFSSTSNDNTVENIEKYNKEETEIYKNRFNPSNRYDKFEDIKLSPVFDKVVKPKIITSYSDQIFYFVNIIKLSVKVFVIVGTFYLFFSKFKNNKLNREYLILCMVCVGVILMMYVLPVISRAYNLTRLYQQILILLSLPAVYLGFLLLRFFTENLKTYLISIIFILYFLYASGFVYQIFGGYAFLQLNNIGVDYDEYYTHQVEVNSAAWLSKNRYDKNLIFADEISALRLYSFDNLNNIENVILPSTITKDSYVYLRYANIVMNRTDASYENKKLIYTYPSNFLVESKNLIYNNGGSEIFK